ncbi:uncharacterized protein LOC127808649 [Diospyros lotus]|uniref:uncharacterized protein LOC127808649 n=1 Tax=Diospyros lotus TaxID=55363 RepID=UPI002250E9BA|nr:uncharacterized protein LOC127808649 [Diospyros lotus]
MGDESSDGQVIDVEVKPVDLGNPGNCKSPRNSIDQNHRGVSQTVIVMKSDEEGESRNGHSNGHSDVLRKIKDSKEDKKSCVIDVNCGVNRQFGEKLDGERVCRICHLSSDPSASETPPRLVTTATTSVTPVTDAKDGLMQLGCGCKDDLGIVHSTCAETWFKLKGYRQCEICGETARNVTGVGDYRFIEEWTEPSRSHAIAINLPDGRRRCCRGKPFCNFLMACLLIAFVLSWFFRVNML